MPPRKRKHWIKLWLEWFTSPSHAGIDATSHGIVIRCLMQAAINGWDESGAGWLVRGANNDANTAPTTAGGVGRCRALTVLEIGALCSATPEQVEHALSIFIDAGTMVQREDGAYGFLGLRDWQESREAERIRRVRRDSNGGNSGDGGAKLPTPRQHRANTAPTPRQQSPAELASNGPQRSEVRGQKISDTLPSEESPAAAQTPPAGVEPLTLVDFAAEAPTVVELRPQAMVPVEPAVLVFPCTTGARGRPREWPLTQSFINELADGCPDVDILAEARKALLYVKTNTKKTYDGMPEYLRKWMTRAQNWLATAGPSQRPRNAAEQRVQEAFELVRRTRAEEEL